MLEPRIVEPIKDGEKRNRGRIKVEGLPDCVCLRMISIEEWIGDRKSVLLISPEQDKYELVHFRPGDIEERADRILGRGERLEEENRRREEEEYKQINPVYRKKLANKYWGREPTTETRRKEDARKKLIEMVGKVLHPEKWDEIKKHHGISG